MGSRRIPGTFFFAVCLILGASMLGLMVYVLHGLPTPPETHPRILLAFGVTTLALYALLYRLFLRRSNTIRDRARAV